MDRLSEIRARCEAFEASSDAYKDVRPQYILPVLADDGYPHNWAEIAAHSHEDIPYLLGRLEKAEAENRWIPVGERLPKSGEHVLLCCEIRPAGKRYVCGGYYAAPKSIACNNPESAIDYDEETDEYYLLEGWYEVIKNWDDFSSVCIDDFVTHWRPLPEPPKGE